MILFVFFIKSNPDLTEIFVPFQSIFHHPLHPEALAGIATLILPLLNFWVGGIHFLFAFWSKLFLYFHIQNCGIFDTFSNFRPSIVFRMIAFVLFYCSGLSTKSKA
jgi:hypothetical protein